MAAQREILLCRYDYDPLDRVVGCAPLGQQSAQRFYRKNRLATEIQGQVQHSVFEHEAQILAQQQRQAGKVDSALLATDLQRSVLHSITAGQHQQPVHSPYGHLSPVSGLISLLGFNGERRDPVTGHYLLGNGYRAFNPVLMRFNSPDKLSPFGKGGLNAYSYCVGDPVNRVDPTGHNSLLAFFGKYLQRATAIAPVSASLKPVSGSSSVVNKLGASVTKAGSTEPAVSGVTSTIGGGRINPSTHEALDLASADHLQLSSGQDMRDLENLGGLQHKAMLAFDRVQTTHQNLETLKRFVASKGFDPADIPAQPAFLAHAEAQSALSTANIELNFAAKVHFLKYPQQQKELVAISRSIIRRGSI
jgi:RHS repeat-associated protein